MRQQRQHGFEREHGLDAFAGGEDPVARGRLDAEAHAIAEQMAERAARIGERRLGRAGAIEPGALDAGDGAVEVGDRGEQRRPELRSGASSASR